MLQTASQSVEIGTRQFEHDSHFHDLMGAESELLRIEDALAGFTRTCHRSHPAAWKATTEMHLDPALEHIQNLQQSLKFCKHDIDVNMRRLKNQLDAVSNA